MKTIQLYLLPILLVVLILSSGCANSQKGNGDPEEIIQLIPMPNKVKVGRDFLEISSGFKLNFAEVTTDIENNLISYLESTSLNISGSGIATQLSVKYPSSYYYSDESYSLSINKDGVKINAISEVM